MEVLNVHIFYKAFGVERSCCQVDVPGFGKVEIEDFISAGLRSMIEGEALLAVEKQIKSLSGAEKLEGKIDFKPTEDKGVDNDGHDEDQNAPGPDSPEAQA